MFFNMLKFQNFFQGPLEKSLQSSSVSERQRNVEHKVTAIKNSVQVSGPLQMVEKASSGPHSMHLSPLCPKLLRTEIMGYFVIR